MLNIHTQPSEVSVQPVCPALIPRDPICVALVDKALGAPRLNPDVVRIGLDPSHDPFDFISKMARLPRVRTLKIYCHGRPGALLLNGRWYDEESVDHRAQIVRQWNFDRIEFWSKYVACCPGLLEKIALYSGAEIMGTKFPMLSQKENSAHLTALEYHISQRNSKIH
jgi:Domain of unknown function (DUF4347)